MKTLHYIEKALSEFLDLIFPKTCAFCGELEQSGLCKECAEKNKASMRKAQAPVPRENHEAKYIRSAYAPFWYDEVIKELVQKLKFQSELHLISFCAGQMLSCLPSGTDENEQNSQKAKKYDIIVCVPKKVRIGDVEKLKRENIPYLLAKRISSRLDVPFDYNALKKLRVTRQQSALVASERLLNVKGAYSARRNVFSKRRVLLIDDVYTTGATANECARAIMKDGAKYCDVLCFAASYKF